MGEILNGMVREGNQEALPRALTQEERALMRGRLQLLDSALRPVSYASAYKQRAGAAVAEMLLRFPTFAPKERQKLIGKFVIDMQELPIFAIELACEDVKQGRVEDLNKDFPPTIPRLIEIARKHSQSFENEHRALRRIQSTKLVYVEHVQSPEVLRKLKELSVSLKHKDTVEETERRAELSRQAIKRNNEEILKEYKTRGLPPVYGPGKLLISPYLLRKIPEMVASLNDASNRKDTHQFLDGGS